MHCISNLLLQRGVLSIGAVLGLGIAPHLAWAGSTDWVNVEPAFPPAAASGAVDLPKTTQLHIVLLIQSGVLLITADNDWVTSLQASGFTDVNDLGGDEYHVVLEATGTAAQVESYFNTSLKSFQYEGHMAYGNATPVQVREQADDPNASWVARVMGVQSALQAHTFLQVAASESSPLGPTASGQATNDVPLKMPHELTEFPALYNASDLPTGANGTVAMVASGDVSATLADLKAYTRSHHLPDVETDVVPVGHGTYSDDPKNDLVWTTAAEAIVAMAGGVKRLVIYNPPDLSVPNLLDVLSLPFFDNQTPPLRAVLLPFAMSEQDGQTSGLQDVINILHLSTYDFVPPPPPFGSSYFFTSLFIAPSGDTGAYANANGVILDAQGHWLVDPKAYSVNVPGSGLANIVAIGGTSLYTSGGSYGYETVWNSGVAPVDPNNPASPLQLHATGGGRPNGDRPYDPYDSVASPAFALDADPLSGALVYRQGQAKPVQVGGTVLAAALYTGLRVRLNANVTNPPFNILGWGPDPAGILPRLRGFNTVCHTNFYMQQLVRPLNTGNNGYGGYGYQAGVGYDGVGGWGSPNGSNLARMLSHIPNVSNDGTVPPCN